MRIPLPGGAGALRGWILSDAEDLVLHANDVEVWRRLRDSFPHPYTLENARDWLQRVSGPESVTHFAIEVQRRAVGSIGYVPGIDVHRLSAEVGFWLGRSFWGCGLATAALAALGDHVFMTTPIVRLHALVFAGNLASIRVLEKCGYRHEGTLRSAVVKEGRLYDAEVLARLR